MAGTTIILTVLFGVAAIPLFVILAALVWVLLKERATHRHVEADEMRDRAEEETLQARQRETVADETVPRGRGAQAEADVKAAQAAGQWPVGTVQTARDLSPV
jgi:hypothetical protein